MVKTTVPQGLEAGFAQPVITTLTHPSEDKDVQVVQFMDELEGGGEPQPTVVQQSHEKTSHQAEDHKTLTAVHARMFRQSEKRYNTLSHLTRRKQEA